MSASRRDLSASIEAFINRASHRRGRAFAAMAEASVTVPQAVLMNHALAFPGSTPSGLADRMQMSISSVSQMIERLVRLGYIERREDAGDRRRKAVAPTEKAVAFLTALREARIEDLMEGTAPLTERTQALLFRAIRQALLDLSGEEAAPPRSVPRRAPSRR